MSTVNLATVALIGSDGGLSRALADALRTAGHPLTTPTAETVADSGAATWVYSAGERGDRWGLPDLDDAGPLFASTNAAGCTRLVVLSSSAVHEPSAHHPGQLDETRMAPERNGNPIARRWAALESAASEAAERGVTVHLLRLAPCPTRDGRDTLSRALRGPLTATPLGFDPSLQLLDTDDAVRAVVAAVDETLDGERDDADDVDGAARPIIHHVAPRTVVPLRQAMRRARTLRLPLPGPAHAVLRRLLAPLGVMLPPAHLDYLRYPFTVSGAKLEQALERPPEHASASTLARLRGTKTSTPEPPDDFDDFGLDRAYIDRLGKTLFRFLHESYWRVEHRGLEHVPCEGPAVLAGFHRGFMPWDGVMAMHLIARRLDRYARFLVHPTLIKHPVLTPYMTRLGGVPACRENGDWVLGQGDLLAIFPEGIQGAFVYYKDAYKLGRFGRAEYVKMALRNRAPIVPFVTVGHAEIFPILAKLDWPWWRKHVEWPSFPITPTMGTVPLPSKWHTLFLEPLHVEREYPPEAANDPKVVRAINREVRARMRAGIESMLERRKSIWYGSVFDAPKAAAGDEVVA